MTDIVEVLKRMPGTTQTAYAKAIMGLLRRRPDLRRDYSSADLAWLGSVAEQSYYRRGCEKCRGTYLQYSKDGPVGFCECTPPVSPRGEKHRNPLVPHLVRLARRGK